jgi:hypothetical protein
VPPSVAARPLTTHARAERDGRVLCPSVLVAVHGKPWGLGTKSRDDMTAWFYGVISSDLEEELEELADAARGGQPIPIVEVDFVLQAPGGELHLRRCRLGLPLRHAGPASTLEYQFSHAGASPDEFLKAA